MAAVLCYKSGGGHCHAGLHTGSLRIAQLLSSTTRLQVTYIVFPCCYEYPIFLYSSRLSSIPFCQLNDSSNKLQDNNNIVSESCAGGHLEIYANIF